MSTHYAGQRRSIRRNADELSSDDVRRPEDSSAIWEAYAACAWLFTPKQLDALRLRFQERLSVAEVASRLGIASSSVSERLTRAREILEAHLKDLRRERFEMTRELL